MTTRQNPQTLAISGQHHARLVQHLFPGDGNEAVALALCGRADNARRSSLLVREIIPIPYAACRVRSPYRVTWSPEAVVPALTKAMNEHLGVVKIHSHPGGYPNFSETDDVSDRDLFASIFGWLDSDAPQASAIMLPGGRIFGRAVHPGQVFTDLEEIRVAGDNFEFWRRSDGSIDLPEHAVRIAQVFGEATFQKLRTLRIGVVGCSGTGSVVIEQLARNCVGELVIVDPDIIEARNLNRILNSTKIDADGQTPKTEVMKRAIQNMGLDTKVYAFQDKVLSRKVVSALASCDVLFGCVDSTQIVH